MAKRKNPAAVALGKRGAKARMKKMTPEKRSEVARNAVSVRWAKAKKAAKKRPAAKGECR